MTRNRMIDLLALGVLAIGISACRPSAPAATTAESSSARVDVTKDTGDRVTVELLKEPTTVAPFTLTDLDGKTLSSEAWKGKVVLVNFWATWCGPCRAEIPDLVDLQNKYRDQLVIVGISEDEGPVDGVRKFAEQYMVNYPIVMTTDEVSERFPGITALPTTYFLDKDGKVAQKHVGMLHARETEATARLLAGLEVNAEVKRIDDPTRMNPEDVAQLKEIPGVDLSGVPAAKRSEVLQALNSENCTCGCGLTVAKCRVDDPSCTVSPQVAKKIVDRVIGGTSL
jgi:thiol-disulfide isomerase/thioredoxin